MSLEAIAALLGHRSMRMTLVYAKVSDRTVADEYFRVTQAVEENYRNAAPLDPNIIGENMRRVAADHKRLLGNGHCNRPAELGCVYESMCEQCGFFETGPQFITIIKRQQKHVTQRGQNERAQLFNTPLGNIETNT